MPAATPALAPDQDPYLGARPALTDASGAEDDGTKAGLRLLLVALAGALMVHGALLPFTHGNTYDAYIHMFFGDHYHRSWFDPWDKRWYTGFATTSYPPGTHMAIGALMSAMPLRAAFCVVMMTGILLLTLGTYRFSLLWVPPRAAGYAALALVLSSSVSETVHLFGQLPTIFSLGVFLNGMPWVYRWIVIGGWRNFGAAVAFGAATTAAHHVTTLFGAVLFIIPLALQALRAAYELARKADRPSTGSVTLDAMRGIFSEPRGPWRWLRGLRPFGWPVGRGLLLGLFLIIAMVGTIFPYWYWSVTDPITQVSIPHGSRESFLLRPDLGLVFFVMPWGASILALPYAMIKGFRSRLWPLAGSVALCFVLGTGGTTPLPRILLRGAFDILTLDRFTYWATILILPFVGLMFDGLLHGRSGRLVEAALGRGLRRVIIAGLFMSYVAGAIFCAVLPAIRPMQPAFLDPTPIANFLNQDQHDRWRYLTLGFGDQFAYVSAQTTAQSVDGNYHSARRLPDMMNFSVERLENAKYLGVPGIGSLQQFLVNPDRYHLKYVFSNDAFYDPLLTFTGWNQLSRLPNGVVIWERPDVSPLPRLQPQREIPRLHRLMWGILPPGALILAALIMLTAALNRSFARPRHEDRPVLQPAQSFVDPRRIRRVVLALAAVTGLTLAWGGWHLARQWATPLQPQTVVQRYFDDLDFRRYDAAYGRLDPVTRGSFDLARFPWRWRGGLIASYGKLSAIKVTEISRTSQAIDWQVDLDWLSSLDLQHESLRLRTVKRDGQWFVVPTILRPIQTPVRIERQESVAWNVTGRRQPRPEADLHRDRLDRPVITLGPARLVRFQERFSIIGTAYDADADPAYLTLSAKLFSTDGQLLSENQSGSVATQRLLPGESGAFRIAFEGVLSLEDAKAEAGFDPKLYVPPIWPARPADAQLAARALVSAQNLYRGIALNGVTTALDAEGGLVISGTAVNIGTETASVVRIVALVRDAAGLPVWAEAGYVPNNILPGQSSAFTLTLPPARAIEVLADIDPATHEINGSSVAGLPPGIPAPGATAGTIPLDGKAGYGSLRLETSSMTFDPEF